MKTESFSQSTVVASLWIFLKVTFLGFLHQKKNPYKSVWQTRQICTTRKNPYKIRTGYMNWRQKDGFLETESGNTVKHQQKLC